MILGSVSFAIIGAMIATTGALLAGASVAVCVLAYIGGGVTTTIAGLALVILRTQETWDGGQQPRLI